MSVKAVEEVSTQVPGDEFQSLEEKIYRTIELYKTARAGRMGAERDAQRLREQIEEREEELESLRKEVIALRTEREEARGRVDKVLRQSEHIREEPSAG